MAMTDSQKKNQAKEFAKRWKGKGYEKGQSQMFWMDLLEHVYGVENAAEFMVFEDKVKLDKANGFIDVMIPSTHVMIEQKSLGKSLSNAILQSDGSYLSPFQQAKRYSSELPYSQRPRYIITCNFEEFYIYDMEKPNAEPEKILLKDLQKEYYRLEFIVKQGDEHLQKEMDISIKAGDLIGKIYDLLRKQYKNPDDKESLKALNVLCVRLVFCLYAEDSEIFPRNSFGDFLKPLPAEKMRKNLRELFQVLDTPAEQRDPYLEDALSMFPYVNGGLFSDENIEIPMFTDEIKDVLINELCAFDWEGISPTIFGAIFESTLNPETRRSGGMHYTSIENIHKVIDPLFLDDLKEELERHKALKDKEEGKKRLEKFRQKLGSLVFLDPACGSGNFLTETYMSLRKLENEALSAIHGGQGTLLGITPIYVSIHQFYGIEINDFAVSVAKTALWIAEHKMLKETESVMQVDLDFLPLKTYTNMVEANALRINWEDIVSKEKLSYIIGNPPFNGARLMSKAQKDDVNFIFDGVKNVGNLDYVACWYKKSADIMTGTNIKTTLVSTNSITQGEQVAILWKELFSHGVHIDFAYKTFRWDSEASIKAHVHCVIVGFSKTENTDYKKIFENDRFTLAMNINGYLVEADNVVIDSRTTPLCSVPKIGIGNQPIDDGNYLFTKQEMEEFIKSEPKSANYFKKWYGSKEFINGSVRYCLWLGECSPKELRSMPKCMERVENVRQFRLKSTRNSTVKLANTPTRFQTENMPNGNYLLIPRVSSENRRYIPIGFMDSTMLSSDSVHMISNATLYHFGVLTSNVHMAWMRTVCGRLKSDYRYSKNIVYNNFPWCTPTAEQKAKIEKTAQAILDARAMYPDCSLADLYDELTMPSELRKAHQANDRAVMEAYGFWGKLNTESECVAALMKMYQKLVEVKG